jgi:hypothetical protein
MRYVTIVAVAALALIIAQGSRPKQTTPANVASGGRSADVWSKTSAGRFVLRACGNCHSYQTTWPWYSKIVPVSWWITHHVTEGRKHLNLSEWENYSVRERRDKLDSICGLILTGRMPPRLYVIMHPEAKLTDKEKKLVCDSLTRQAG